MLTAESFIKRKEEQFKKNNRVIWMKDIGREGKFGFKREAWTFLPQSNLNKKVFVFERLKKVQRTGKLTYEETWKEGDIEYRIGYFIIGGFGKTKGKWLWGQYCPLIPHYDLVKLLEKARTEKVLLT